jgi:hypothetical protein
MQEKLYPQLTKKQHEKDSEVYGAVMAGAKTRKKRLMRSVPAMECTRSLCAIGAGNRGRKVTRVSDILTKSYLAKYHDSDENRHQLIPLIRFSTIMDVSEDYACGVNDGFEGDRSISREFFPGVNTDSLDYERGWHVGQAVAAEAGY